MFFWKKRAEDLKIENPEADVLYAPISGKVIPLEQVDDMVFSQKMMGDGIAIEPEEGRLYAPVSGTVSVVFPTGHVVGIEGTGGANVIMHVGIDTVELKGQGFDVKVKQGDTVKAGTLLMEIDLAAIRTRYAATTMVVIENSREFQLTPTQSRKVTAGEQLLRVERTD